jgi:hypothetical protein
MSDLPETSDQPRVAGATLLRDHVRLLAPAGLRQSRSRELAL